MEKEIDISFQGDVYVDVPEDLIQRMYDVVNAVAHGHESIFLMAEAVHLMADIDKLFNPVLHLEHEGEEEEE